MFESQSKPSVPGPVACLRFTIFDQQALPDSQMGSNSVQSREAPLTLPRSSRHRNDRMYESAFRGKSPIDGARFFWSTSRFCSFPDILCKSHMTMTNCLDFQSQRACDCGANGKRTSGAPLSKANALNIIRRSVVVLHDVNATKASETRQYRAAQQPRIKMQTRLQGRL